METTKSPRPGHGGPGSGGTPPWPPLPIEEWQDTCTTLHLWMQVVGKIRLKLSPMTNHWWQVPFYVTSRGLTTSPIPYQMRTFEMNFDFVDHRMHLETNDGQKRSIDLKPRPVADFYTETLGALRSLGIGLVIWTKPVEVEERIPFEQDHTHASYDPEYANRWWRALVQVDRVFKDFRSRFIGKASPVHLFWGAFDIAVTRFSGRKAPEHPGVPNVGHSVMVEAYSHEVSSCGFWPGAGLGMPAFYSYAYPEPEAFRTCRVKPGEAYYDEQLREFLLPYDVVRTAKNPDEVLLAFLQSTYEAAAKLALWDRNGLERSGP
ncbi:MAG: DUF5996 family protein [Syntrophobacteraceae bacterium]|nr:DUF5996 family protein [Syntrophobacteraceae bacterium]